MKYKNLNEQLNRMKSLMGDDRLYGNLVEATNKVLSENGILLNEQTPFKSLLRAVAKGDPRVVNNAIKTLRRVDDSADTLSLIKQLEDFSSTNPNKPLTDDLIRSLEDRIEVLSQKGDLNFNTIARNIINLDDKVYRGLVDQLSPEETSNLITSFRKDVNDLFDKYNKWVDENITAEGFNIETVNEKIKNNVDILINQKWVKEFPGSDALLRRQVQYQLDNLLETNIQKHNDHVGYTKKGKVTTEPKVNLKSIDDSLLKELEMGYSRVYDDFLENNPDFVLSHEGKLVANPKQMEKMEEEFTKNMTNSKFSKFINSVGKTKWFQWVKKIFNEFIRLLIIPSDTLVKWSVNTVSSSIKTFEKLTPSAMGTTIPNKLFNNIKGISDFMNIKPTPDFNLKKVTPKGSLTKGVRIGVLGINTFIGQMFFITDFQRFINKSWNETFGRINSDWVVDVDPLEAPTEGPGSWVPIFGNVASYIINYVSRQSLFKAVEQGCTLWRKFIENILNDSSIKRCTPMINYIKSDSFKKNIKNKLLNADCDIIKNLYAEDVSEEERFNRQLSFVFESDPEIKKSVNAIEKKRQQFAELTGQNVGESSYSKVIALLNLLASQDEDIYFKVGSSFNINENDSALKQKIKECGGTPESTSNTSTTSSTETKDGKKVYGGSVHDIPDEVINKSKDENKTNELDVELGDTTKKIVFIDPSQG